MITQDELLQKYNITQSFFRDADISWDDLSFIYNDFSDKNKTEKYQELLTDFETKYLLNTHKAGIHSFHGRIKDPEHLIAKIIRKRKKNYKKYKYFTKHNYEELITDLAGVRCLILFKSDWIHFHKYLLSHFKNNEELYIKDWSKTSDINECYNYIAKPPKAYIRAGDSRDIYKGYIREDCILENRTYRSVHYVVKYNGIYLEIQVRTIFEEGWGEINHSMVYPYFENDIFLKEYSDLLNRVVGLADEMGSYFNRLKKEHEDKISKIFADTEDLGAEPCRKPPDKTVASNTKAQKDCSPQACLEEVLEE